MSLARNIWNGRYCPHHSKPAPHPNHKVRLSSPARDSSRGKGTQVSKTYAVYIHTRSIWWRADATARFTPALPVIFRAAFGSIETAPLTGLRKNTVSIGSFGTSFTTIFTQLSHARNRSRDGTGRGKFASSKRRIPVGTTCLRESRDEPARLPTTWVPFPSIAGAMLAGDDNASLPHGAHGVFHQSPGALADGFAPARVEIRRA